MVRGLPIAVCRQDDLRPVIAAAIAGSIPPLSIATINLNFLRQADSDPTVHATLSACSLRVADGWPVMTLARLSGTPLPERVTGASLVPAVLTWARYAGWRVALVGGLMETREALAQAGTWNDVLCGHWLPTYRAGETVNDPALCCELRAAGADLILVALGCPKQERWLLANLAGSGARAGIGIGGSLEFLAGVRSRAPRWVQRIHLEFAYRFLQEPRRLGSRYLGDAAYWLRLRLSSAE
jgi:N-acetylglucosaminyldiphosphoundecaprenol N-acetyl-beta-D-mannosaminyltransferase